MPTYRTLALAAILASAGCTQHEEPSATLAVEPPPMVEFQMPHPVSPLPKPSFDDPAKIALGKALFRDTRLSADDSVACATCHDLRNGGDDGRRVSVGIAGRKSAVNAPTVFNSSLSFAQFWDGRASTLEEQITQTVENPSEMDGDWDEIVRKLRADAATAKLFGQVYRDGVAADNVKDALAAYLRALITVDAPFDRYLAGDNAALGPEAVSGYQLFLRLGCVSCHQGRAIGGNLFQRFGIMGDYFANRSEIDPADYGRYNVTGRETDRYKFKVPGLRNVARTAPYFHDGSAATLEEAVAVMAEYQLGRPVEPAQIARLVAFLESLSGTVDESLL